MVLGVPPRDRTVIVLVDQQPLLALAARATTDEGEPARELVAVEIEVQAPCCDGVERIAGLGEFPRAPVPHDHVTAAVLAGGDHALELEIVERVVLDTD